ncbi:hypothetical protein AcW1_002127 [Taiwanofungus camphoratus]|nr:hypothetical protein AcV5_010123 [Antrodia cinnamomea]KAI0944404.1 hypothetical protein AcW1_002127 [Antrodia cinnamomea]KAI0946053.1 hypothetical protein AcV7_010134 [Antrodia cinnamomea]
MSTLMSKIAIQVRSVYTRITLTRFTTAFICLTFVHCFAQVAIQGCLYALDANASGLASGIVKAAQIPPDEIPWFRGNNENFDLQLCDHIPIDNSAARCYTIFESATSTGPNASVTTRSWGPTPVRILAPVNSSIAGNGVNLVYNQGADSVFLSQQCTQVMVYPDQMLDTEKREDLALLGAQFWLFAISFIAVLYNSIPQILAVVCSRILATAWSAYSVWQTKHMEVRFQRLLVDPGTPCHIDLFPSHFKTRLALAIPDLVLNITALLYTALLGWHLIKAFNAFTLQRVCPPVAITRIYRLFLAMFVFLQLSIFFMVTAMGLWESQLMNTAIRLISTHTAIYSALFIFTIVTLVPWVVMGWIAVRREMKRTMILFLFTGTIYIVCWSIMFYSKVYRWTFFQWPFFGCMTLASFIVLVGACAFGITCRLNFEKGLAHYLHVEAALAKSNFAPEVFRYDTTTTKSAGILSGRSPTTAMTLKRDDNWDFDVERPPIIIVELEDRKSSSSL